MKVNEISYGWAMQQQDPIEAIRQVGRNLRQYAVREAISRARRIDAALHRQSATFTAIAGEPVTRLDVLKAHAYLAVVAVCMLLASWQEGGAL